MTMLTPALTETDHQHIEQHITAHPQREDRAIGAVLGVLEYCQKLEDQDVQRIVTRNLRKIVHTSFDIPVDPTES